MMKQATDFFRFSSMVVAILFLVACGGGGGEDPANTGTTGPTQSVNPAVYGVNINNVTQPEGDSGTTQFIFTLYLAEPVQEDTTVDYEVNDFINSDGNDYLTRNGSVTIAAGQSQATLSIDVVGDTELEDDQFFQVVLTGTNNNVALGTYTTGIGHIIDDEVPISVNANLTDGGTYTDSTGIRVTAPVNSIYRPLELTVQTVSAPSESLPFGTTVLSNYHKINLDRAVIMPQGKKFTVSLPVPPQADTQHLAMFVQTDWASSHASDNNRPIWMPIQGVYDPSSNNLNVEMPVIRNSEILVLVENPNLDSPLTETTGMSVQGIVSELKNNIKYRSNAVLPVLSHNSVDFNAHCVGFADARCTETVEQVAEEHLRKIRKTYIDKWGYGEPNLAFYVNPLSLNVVYSRIYLVPKEDEATLPPFDCTQKSGLYSWSFSSITICLPQGFDINNSSDKDLLLRFLDHEYFHSLQFSFYNMELEIASTMFDFSGAPPADNLWVIEATTTASVASYDVRPNADFNMERKSGNSPADNFYYPFRTVDTALYKMDAEERQNAINRYADHRLVDYLTQDFWVFISRTQGDKSLSDLKGVFSRGTTPEKVNEALLSSYGISLQDAYWEWVKNQFIEHTEKLASNGTNQILKDFCTADPSLTDFSQLSLNLLDEDFNPPSNGGLEGTALKPFDSAVYQITIAEVQDAILGMWVDSDSDELSDAWINYTGGPLPAKYKDLRFKIYEHEEAFCDSVDQSNRVVYDILHRPVTHIYVVVSNVSMDGQTHDWRIQWD